MYLEMLASKIHRAHVTQADLHYVGSITVDRDLMDAAALRTHQKVDVVDIDNGARLSTYVIEGERGSGVIGMNGAAARLVHPGDKVILMAYASVHVDVADDVRPNVVFVDEHNRPLAIGDDPLAVPEDVTDLVPGDVIAGSGR